MSRIASWGGRLVRSPRSLRSRPGALVSICLAALLIAGAVGIAVGKTGGGTGQNAQAAQPSSPICAQAGKSVARPEAVPAELLPPGTVLTSTKRLGDGRTVVGGVISRDFRTAVSFFVKSLPKAGYRNISGDAEMDEAESFFEGARLSGKWKVNGILNCQRAVTLALYVKPRS
jgi:hypothetical protein